MKNQNPDFLEDTELSDNSIAAQAYCSARISTVRSERMC
jgi:hypothetical protein